MSLGLAVLLVASAIEPAAEEDAGVIVIDDAGIEAPEEVPDAGEPLDAGTDVPLLADPDAGVAEPKESKPLNTVVVGTSEERVAGSMHTIKGARLKRFELDDPTAVLQAVPGVYVRGEDGFGLRPNVGLRGANADRSKKVTLMED